ncbi:MAG: MCP four helix bundle domain-containing protein [Aeromicrobium sp.]|nr:MCP four helix bundle domain-containing protein [Burkholderiales bacterium]
MFRPKLSMNWLTSQKVATQLFIAFTVLILSTIALGVFAVDRLSSVTATSSEISDKWMPGIGHAFEMRAKILDFRQLESKHTRAEDEGYMTEYEEKMAALVTDIKKASDAFDKLATEATERAAFEKFKKSLAQYQSTSKRVVELGRAKKQTEARDLEDGAAKIAVDETIEALDKVVKASFAGANAAAGDARGEYAAAKRWIVIVVATAVVISLFFAVVIVRSLTRQLGGEPRALAAIAERIANGDLRTDVLVKAGDTTSLVAQMKFMQQSIATIVFNVRSNAEAVARASKEIASGNHDLSSRTEQQASALAQAGSSMGDLREQIKHSAESATQANSLAQVASGVATKGGDVVASVVSTMKGINDSSKKIAEITGLIDGIAFQTNILALNAAVEAARAGEQGRGFAVVATEVRSLAARSAEAAKQIKRLIDESVGRIEKGTQQVDQAGTTMTDVVASIQRVTDLIAEITAASVEQSAGVVQVVESVTEMDRTTQHNAALVEQLAPPAGSLQDQAEELVQVVAAFKTDGADSMNDGAIEHSPNGRKEPTGFTGLAKMAAS